MKPLYFSIPFESEPQEHLKFDELGMIAPREHSVLGRTSIDTLKLNREGLVSNRLRILQSLSSCEIRLNSIAEREDARDLDRLCLDLYRLGGDDAPYAGMVRSMSLRFLGDFWDTWEAFAEYVELYVCET